MSLEANKIAAAVLVGGMLTLGSGLVANMIYGGHEGAEHGEAKEAASAAMPAAPAAPIAPVSGLLAAADPAKGEATAKACLACHNFDKGGANKVGPNLWGVAGNKTAHKEDFNYSDAIKKLAGTWTFENLNHFLASPKTYAPGTKMSFPGLTKVEDRANVIAWLNSKSDAPLAAPTADEIKAAEDAAQQAAAPAAEEAAPAQPEAEAAPAAEEPAAPAAEAPAAEAPAAEAPAAEAPAAAAAPAGGDDAVAMIATADPAAGEKVAAKCKACHDFTKGGPNKVGPNLWGVVGGPSAHKEDYKYSDVIANLKITWDFANLDKYLISPKAFAKGNKMTFPGLAKAADRAALLRWLRDQSDSPIALPQ